MYSWFTYLKWGLSRTLPDDGVAEQPEQPKYADMRANLRNLRPSIARHWRQGVLGVVLILFSSLLGFSQPLVNRYLIDDVILSQQLNLLPGVVLLLAGIKIVTMLSGSLQQFYFTRFEQDILLDIQGDLFHRVLRFPKSFFDGKEIGYLMSRLTSDLGGLRWFFSSALVHIVSNILRFVGGCALLFYLEWRLALVALIVIPGMVICVRFFSRKFRVLSHQSMEQQANVSRRLQESLSAASLIKAFVSEEREADRIISEAMAGFRISLEQVVVGSAANLTLGALGDVAKFVVLFAGAYLVIVGEWSLGSLLAFQAYLGYVYGPAQFLATASLQLQNALAALERVSALFDIVPEENSDSGQKVARLRGEIEFKDVSFSYGDREAVLQDVSCLIRPGEHMAIVGPSGVGKTTLVSLILRFYKPTLGEIWFDGRPASEYQVSSLRQRIGYVSQNTLLLSGTINDNLRYGNPEASQEQITRAAQTAGIHDFIVSLPEGYDSMVGERGVNLSEGQKQRLSIARALIKEPDVLVLDEPTSALDSLVERSIFDSLPALIQDKTSFVVAHRLSTIQNASRILLLNEKQLIGMGTHQELLDGNAYYRSLVANQQIITGNGL